MSQVGVCIPVYNGERYISETVQSVLAQTFRDFKIYILDNASTDGTWNILTQLAYRENVHIFRNDITLDMGDNWNKVISYCKEDYLLILSADDLLMPAFLQEAVALLKSQSVDIYSSNYFLFSNNWERRRRVLMWRSGVYRKFTKLILLVNPFSINFTLFKKEVVNRMKDENDGTLFAPSHTCDYDLWIRLSPKYSVYYDSRILGKYRVHENNLSNNKKRMVSETLSMLNKNSDFLRKECFLVFYFAKLRLLLRLSRIEGIWN